MANPNCTDASQCRSTIFSRGLSSVNLILRIRNSAPLSILKLDHRNHQKPTEFFSSFQSVKDRSLLQVLFWPDYHRLANPEQSRSMPELTIELYLTNLRDLERAEKGKKNARKAEDEGYKLRGVWLVRSKGEEPGVWSERDVAIAGRRSAKHKWMPGEAGSTSLFRSFDIQTVDLCERNLGIGDEIPRYGAVWWDYYCGLPRWGGRCSLRCSRRDPLFVNTFCWLLGQCTSTVTLSTLEFEWCKEGPTLR